jgi:CubicO group peptidase (beta-lactamase class C family)
MLRAVEIIDQHTCAGQYSGAALIVVKAGQIVLEHYAGEAAPGLASDANVLWPIASISKVYTATMILRLVEEGLLTLNTPVCEMLSSFRGGGREEIRLRHLLTHTAGMIYESPEMEKRLLARTPITTLIDEALSSPLLFRPGTAFRYADYHYLVAGHVAEVAAGSALTELIATFVLDPGYLIETFIPPRRADSRRLAKVAGVMAEGTDGAMYNSWYARELAHPAFGVFATARDLARFGSFFAPSGPQLLSAASVRAMTTDQTGVVPGQHPSMNGYAADLRVPWGIGFALQTDCVPCLFSDLASFRAFGHNGASGCGLVIDPTQDLVVAVLTNTHLSTGRDRWTMRLQSILNSVFAEFAQIRVAQGVEA